MFVDIVPIPNVTIGLYPAVFFFCLIFTRDIPMPLVSSGVEHGNLRELALARMKDMGTEVKKKSEPF